LDSGLGRSSGSIVSFLSGSSEHRSGEFRHPRGRASDRRAEVCCHGLDSRSVGGLRIRDSRLFEPVSGVPRLERGPTKCRNGDRLAWHMHAVGDCVLGRRRSGLANAQDCLGAPHRCWAEWNLTPDFPASFQGVIPTCFHRKFPYLTVLPPRRAGVRGPCAPVVLFASRFQRPGYRFRGSAGEIITVKSGSSHRDRRSDSATP